MTCTGELLNMLRYLFLFLFFPLLLFSEDYYVKNNAVENKTIEVSIFNNSRFDIEIIKEDFLSEPVFKIEPFKTRKLIRNVSNEKLYLFYRYLIPVGDGFIPLDNFDWRFPIIFNKNQLLKIPEIKENPEREIYCIIKNISDTPIYLCHSTITYKSIKNSEIISAGGIEVFSSKDCHFFLAGILVFISNQVSLFPLPEKDLQPGYVYTYSFDGTSVVKEDERPLINMNEPLWSKPYTSTEIAGIFSGTDKELYYAIGKENKKNEHGELYEAAYISCMDSSGAEKWQKVFTENNCDTSFYSGIVLEDGSFLAAGSHTKEAHAGLIVQYSKNGTVLQSQKISSFSLFDSIIKIDGETTLLTGFDSDGNFLTAKLTIKNNSLNCIPQNSSIPLNENEAVSKAVPFYDEASKTLLLFCNLMDKETEQTLPSMVCTVSGNGNFERLSLQNTVKAISSVVRDSNGLFYIGGETVKKEQSAASVVCFDYSNKKTSVFYTDGFPYSYISAMHVNQKSHELIISGTLKASDAFGNSGVPFIKSFDIGTGKELWKTVYQNKQYELLSSFVPCARYGFIATFTNVSEDGEYTTPVGVLRLNAVGKGGIDN